MVNLLNGNLMRIKKSKLFLVMSLAILVLAILLILVQYKDFISYKTIIEYDSLYKMFLLVVGIVISIFTCLFLGVEYEDKTIRNKIIIGHKRINIYLANLITIILVSLVFQLLYIFIISVVGIPLLGFNISSVSSFIYSLIVAQLIIIANASIYTLISLVGSNSMLINIICLLVAFGSYFATLILMNIIDTPEYIQMSTIVNWESEKIEYVKEKNPKYPSEIKRKICNTLMNIIPQAQVLKIERSGNKDRKMIPIYSLSTSVVLTGIGIVLFKKKEFI